MQLVVSFVILFFVVFLKLCDLLLIPWYALKRLFRHLKKAGHRALRRLHRPHLIFPKRMLPARRGTLQHKASVPKKPVRKAKSSLFFPTFGLKLKYFVFGTIFSLVFIFLPALFFLFLQELPDPHELTYRHIPQTTRIYDRHGTLLYQIYAQQNRTLIPLSDVPQSLQEATLAIEDKNFYTHPGFDLPSILRALLEDLSGKKIQGGSTITQQLIKSSLLTPEQSLIRKIKEVILAFWAERLYSKRQILEMYFNEVPYGGTAWGVEAASEIYFGKPIKDLTLGESAFLAGLTSAPSDYSPYGPTPNLWKKRQQEVLRRMVLLGYISEKQAQDAAEQKLVFKGEQAALKAPHFVQYVKNLLIQRYGLAMVERGGLTVTTSLDLSLQDQAQKIVSEEVQNASYLNVTNGAALVTDPRNGDILAMIGSKDYNDPTVGKFNVTTAFRQPGSTVKVITYSAALAHGFTAASILDDTPTSFPVAGGPAYAPVNYDGHYYGKVPLRFALSNSLNVPAVRTLNQIGVPTMIKQAQNMGISEWNDPSQYGLSVTLGGAETTMLDMATVFGTLATGGTKTNLDPILKVADSNGAVIDEKQPTFHPQVMDQGIAYIISDILADNQTRTAAFGPNSVLAIPGHFVSVKTGTTDNKRDNWTIGYTDKDVVTVWVGNNDNSPMNQALASGITGAAPIWHRIMADLVTKNPETKRAMPSDVTQIPCLGRMEYFLKGTETTANCAKPMQFPVTLTPTPAAQLAPPRSGRRNGRPF